jgi:hypothetical protein
MNEFARLRRGYGGQAARLKFGHAEIVRDFGLQGNVLVAP